MRVWFHSRRTLPNISSFLTSSGHGVSMSQSREVHSLNQSDLYLYHAQNTTQNATGKPPSLERSPKALEVNPVLLLEDCDGFGEAPAELEWPKPPRISCCPPGSVSQTAQHSRPGGHKSFHQTSPAGLGWAPHALNQPSCALCVPHEEPTVCSWLSLCLHTKLASWLMFTSHLELGLDNSTHCPSGA